MNVVVGSIFRNSSGYVPRYFEQVRHLQLALAHSARVRVIAVEGDSTDATWDLIATQTQLHAPVTLVKREHGGPSWGSVDDASRWRALSWCCNGVLDALQPSDDFLIYVESDLIWEPETMLKLLSDLESVPAVAALCFTQAGWFYDTWGHRGLDGVPFGPFPPYHRDIDPRQGALTRIASAGSCIAMRGEVARAARFGPDDCVLGLGRSIYQAGFELWLDPEAKVVHP